jgi:hypothetical protein
MLLVRDVRNSKCEGVSQTFPLSISHYSAYSGVYSLLDVSI